MIRNNDKAKAATTENAVEMTKDRLLLDSATDTTRRQEVVAPSSAAKHPPQTYLEEICSDWSSPFVPSKVDPQALHRLQPHLTLEEAKAQINARFPTKSELRAVIPPHCFERHTLRSLGFVGRDILQGALVVFLTSQVLSTDVPETWTGWFAWRLGWNVYALIMTYAVGGLWVLGHECGHGAFSPHAWVNGIVGWTLHSIFLVPYFSWAFSHAKHHRRTNDLVDGETHVPNTPEEIGLQSDAATTHLRRTSTRDVVRTMTSSPTAFWTHFELMHTKLHQVMGDDAFSIFHIFEKLFVGYPMYLFGWVSTGKMGNDRKPIAKGTWPDHFRPHSRLFPAKMFWKVVASDVGIALTLSTLAYCSYTYSFRAVWFWYFGPYLLTQAFLVATTWLHHTDPTVPHFDTDHWTWVKGSLAGTIDRPMGPITNCFSHNISSTHVLHHLFHQIPHYHAVEATAALRAFLEPKGLYNYDPCDMDDALYKVAKTCHYVASRTQGVQYYQRFADIDKNQPPPQAAAANKKEN